MDVLQETADAAGVLAVAGDETVRREEGLDFLTVFQGGGGFPAEAATLFFPRAVVFEVVDGDFFVGRVGVVVVTEGKGGGGPKDHRALAALVDVNVGFGGERTAGVQVYLQ